MFNELLQRAGLSKAELARRFLIHVNTPTNWKDEPPGYAIAYLELLIEYNRVRP